jgi:hypothetical protein
MTDLAEEIAKALTDLVSSHEYELPIWVAVVSANGCGMLVSYTAADRGGLEPTVLSEHLVDPGFALPINLFFVDSRGEAARLLVANNEERKLCVLN